MAEGRAQEAGFYDWSPVLGHLGGHVAATQAAEDLDEHAAHRLIAHAAGLGHQHNGMPAVKPYVWRPGEAQREAALEGRLAAIRRVAEQRALARMAHGPTCTCRLCIEQYGPIPPPPPDREACHG